MKVTKIKPFKTQGDEGRLIYVHIVDGEKEYDAEFWDSIRDDYSYRLKRTQMPDSYFGKMAKDFKWDIYREDTSIQKRIVNAFVTQYTEMWQPQHRGLYIYSDVKGSGKTLLACCIGNEIATRYGVNVKFVTAADYLNVIRDKESDMKKQIKECDLLILDDFGVTEDKEWITESFFRLINYRNTNMVSTIITSNLPRDYPKFDDRISSRIRSMCIELRLPEESIRDELTRRDEEKFLNTLFSREVKEENT